MIIRFYGRAREDLGGEARVEPPPGVVTVADLRRFLADRYPWVAADLLGPTLRACVEDRVVGEDHPISGSAEVEFFPPLSGG